MMFSKQILSFAVILAPVMGLVTMSSIPKCPTKEATCTQDGKNYSPENVINRNQRCWSLKEDKYTCNYDVGPGGPRLCRDNEVDIADCGFEVPSEGCPTARESCEFEGKAFSSTDVNAPQCWTRNSGSKPWSCGYILTCEGRNIYDIKTCRNKGLKP